MRAEDMLCNPHWAWQTIKNHEGLSISMAIRELNVALSLRNNFHYTTIVGLNKLTKDFDIVIGGQYWKLRFEETELLLIHISEPTRP